MREYTEPTPIDLQAFSTGRVLKESWEISTKYFGALVMPLFLLMLPGFIIVMIVPGKPGESLNNLISAILCPIAVMGLNRAVLRLKTEGVIPSFSQTFTAGNEYWWRGFKINFVTGIYGIGIGIAIIVMILPGALLASKEALIGGILLTAGAIGCIWILIWFCTRACLAIPAMADNRTSASKAFDAGWDLAKKNADSTRRLVLAIAGISLGLLITFVGAVALAAFTGICSAEIAIGLLAIPALFLYIFCLAYFYVAMNLAYLALKPAPAEEPMQVPAA